jgi:hypothetical protein
MSEWQPGIANDGRVYIGSRSFEHDVRLYLTGDFEDEAERLSYAEMIARMLNSTRAETTETA